MPSTDHADNVRPYFPPELQLAVLREVYASDDKESLSSFSRTCRNMVQPAQQYIFRDISVESFDKSERFLRHLDAYPHLASHVVILRYMTPTEGWPDDRNLLALMLKCSNVRHLGLDVASSHNTYQLKDNHSLCLAVLHFAPSLRSFSFTAHEVSLPTMGILYHLIANMSNRRGSKFAFLSSYAPDLPEMQTVMARLPPTGDPPVLRHLCLPHRNASWLESAPIDVSRLQSLRWWVSWGTKDPVLEHLLARAKDTLSVLEFVSEGRNEQRLLQHSRAGMVREPRVWVYGPDDAFGVPPCPSEGGSLRGIHQLKTLILKGIPLEDPELRRLVRSAPGLDYLVIYPAEKNSWISSTTDYEASRASERDEMREDSCRALLAMCKRRRPIKMLSLILPKKLDGGWASPLQRYIQPLKDRGTQLLVERRLGSDYTLNTYASREFPIPKYVEQCALNYPV
ncbi:hypothetical protein EV121DRAFT_285248 [Schizophyllum commune]